MAHLIQPDGTVTEHTPKSGRDWSLEEMQFLIGGYIERVPTPKKYEAYCNEEGLLRKLPVNTLACLLLRVELVGPILVLDKTERLP